MWRAALDSICPACQSAAVPRSQMALPLSRPWLSQGQLRLQSQQQRLASSFSQRRKTPARMVLSDNVARSPTSYRDGSGRPSRRQQEGPFGAMNRTVANVRPPKSTTTSNAREDRPRERRDAKGGKRSFKALRMHQSLTTIDYGQRTRIKNRMQEIEEFEQLSLLPAIQTAITSDALKGLVDVHPTPIQRLAIPLLLGQVVDRRASRQLDPDRRREFLLAAETGSGKTLAYMLPVVDALKRAEAEDQDIISFKKRLAEEKERRNDPKYRGTTQDFEPHPTTARPRAVILVPSAELVGQVGMVAKSLSHAVKFKTDLMSADVSPKIMQRNLYSPTGIDIVVATPHLLASIADSDPNVLSRVSHLVIDEADSLLDRSFSPATTAIVERALPSLKQLILCSATIPRRLDNYLARHFPRMERITTPNLHAIPRRVQLGVIDVSKDPYRNNKDLACADAIWTIGKDTSGSARSMDGDGDSADDDNIKRIMVFVNERDKAEDVADYLRTKGIDAVALHRDTEENRHSDILAQFTSSTPTKVAAAAHAAALATTPAPTPPRGPGGRTLPNTKVMVATDLASRGIDTVNVRHVVLYDVPHTTIDFIHRLGRAGRMGRRGRGIVLVGKDDRRDVVADVRESMYMGQALV